MSHNSCRAFLAEVGRGMLVAGLGPAAALDLGLAATGAEEEPRALSFGGLEPLVALLQETPAENLLSLLVGRLRDGTDLRTLVAAAALANARTFGGEHYQGFHTFMALAPAYQMARELPEGRRPLPVLKVLYRNTHFIHQAGGRADEKLRPVRPADLPRDAARDELLRDANRRGDLEGSERLFAAVARGPARDAFDDLLLRVEDRGDVHSTVLVWRAWETLDLTGQEHAHTLLRQSVRHCIKVDAGLASAKLVPKLLDQYRLLTRPAGTRAAEDAWLERMSETVLTSGPERAVDAVAAALAEGIAPEDVGEAISLAANQLVLRQVENWAADYYGRRVHGDSPGVHASDAVNAWRNIGRVSNPRHRAAGLILAAAHVAEGHRWSEDRRYRGHERSPFPLAEHLERVKAVEPPALLRELDGAIRENDQFRACAVVQRYGELGHPPRPVFDLLLRYAVSEDGRLHAEKYYRTVTEEFAKTRPAFRWRQLTALARVTASGYGYTADDKRDGKEGLRAPGYEEACRLLKV
jgi:hypothetical protein